MTVCDATWVDAKRGGREVPVRIRMPAGTGPVPVVLFSHGLAGSLDSGGLWVTAWARAGIATINLQHKGSDRAIIADRAIFEAVMPRQLVARLEDVRFVLTALGKRSREGACDLSRIDLTRVGMAGHSYGAITTQALAGERFPIAGVTSDVRIRAALALSPSPPWQGSAKVAFADVRIPFFSITGTLDLAPIQRRVSAADRRVPYASMPSGEKYLLVLAGADHMAFNGADERHSPADLPTEHVASVVISTTTDYWRWTLTRDVAAHRRLIDAAKLLADGDTFFWK